MALINTTRGYQTIVSDEDYDWVSKHNWQASEKPNGRVVISTAIKRKSFYLHRLIMDVTDPSVIVDHIDMNPLNNQRSNLRLVTPSQNQMNRRSTSGSYSKYKGVTWCKQDKTWKVRIGVNSKYKHLGSFKDEQKAALAYNEAAQILHGEYARLNIINEDNTPNRHSSIPLVQQRSPQ